MPRKDGIAVLALAALGFALPLHAQPAQDAQTATAPAQAGVPFTGLADFERLIPIGMTRDDLVKTLGKPPIVVPGQGSDDVYQYPYTRADGAEVRAVIVVRDGKVFIRRLYEKSATGDTTRAN